MLGMLAINVAHKSWVINTVAQQFLNPLAVVDRDLGRHR